MSYCGPGFIGIVFSVVFMERLLATYLIVEEFYMYMYIICTQLVCCDAEPWLKKKAKAKPKKTKPGPPKKKRKNFSIKAPPTSNRKGCKTKTGFNSKSLQFEPGNITYNLTLTDLSSTFLFTADLAFKNITVFLFLFTVNSPLGDAIKKPPLLPPPTTLHPLTSHTSLTPSQPRKSSVVTAPSLGEHRNIVDAMSAKFSLEGLAPGPDSRILGEAAVRKVLYVQHSY